MVNKNKIGALVILGGIALLGYVYFKKTKPTVAKSQSEGLKNLSNFYKSGAGGQEDTRINLEYYQPEATNSFGLNPFLAQDFQKDLNSSLAPLVKELNGYGEIKLSQEAINNIQNMETGLAGIDFSSIKF